MKDNVKSVVVLTMICLVVAGLLSVTNFYTAPVIEAAKAAAASGSLAEVMPEAAGFEEVELPADAPATVQAIYKETSGLGYVVTLVTTSQYSSGDMAITVAIGVDGKISGITLTSYYESKDFGTDTYPQTYIGADSSLGSVDLFAGVTYSSSAFMDAIADAFTVLLEVGDIAEGEKSEEQLIAEVMPLALPGCANALGNAIVEEVDAQGFTACYAATNGCGYIVITSGDAGTLVCGVNAFGDVKCFDLDGNEVDGPVDELKAAFGNIASDALADNEGLVTRSLGDDATALTPVESTGTFESVIGAFTTENNDTIFIVQPLAYGDETMKMVVGINENGEVMLYRLVSELILHGEYYSQYDLPDQSAYLGQFVGLTEGSYSADMSLISGATFSANAVDESITAAYHAYNSMKGAN